MASYPIGLWIGCRLSLLLLLFAGCLIENITTALSEPGHQNKCLNGGMAKTCTDDTGKWCAATVTLDKSNIYENTPVFEQTGCTPLSWQAEKRPTNETHRCVKDLDGSFRFRYNCFCNAGRDLCNADEGSKQALFAEARRQYSDEFDPTTTTTPASTSEIDPTPEPLTTTTIIIIGAIVVFIIGAVALSVIGCWLWKREQGRNASKSYGDFGLMQIVAKTVLEAWVKYDLKIEGEFGLSPEANAANLIKGEQLDKTFYFKPSQHKAMALEKKVEVKVVEQKMVHANYVDDNIICTFEPDSSTIGVWIKMAVGVMPALIVTIDNQLELADILTCGLLGDNPAAPKQNAVPIKKKNKNGFQNKGDLISCRQIQLTDEEKSHKCEHLMYGCWPEGDIPTMNNEISLLAAYVYENYVSQNKLIIITSNRGCGRAGTFAFTQVLLKAASTSNCSNDDVIEMAKKIRHSRFAAIGGPMQFGFGISLALSVHGTRLSNEDLRKKSRALERNFDTEIKNLHKLMSKAENFEKQNVPENPAGTVKKAEATGRSGRSEAKQKPGSPVKEDPSMSKVAPEDTVYGFKSIR